MLPAQNQRSIKFAQFSNDLGLISAEDLISARTELWREWRSRITDNRSDSDAGYHAECYLCDGRVHIYVTRSPRSNTELPAFRHAKGAGEACPWHTGQAMSPENARKLQYLGEQESPLHKQLCLEIYNLLVLDDRVTKSTCNKRYTSAEGERWKVPDVAGEIQGYGKIAVEIQLSNTFQTEVSERAKFYNKEGIGLIWIFPTFDPSSIPTSFQDVIHRQRGNAFVLDMDAKLASISQKTLCLKCYLRNKDGFDQGKVVRIDQLVFPTHDCMYFDDRLVRPFVDEYVAYRQKWRRLLKDQNSPYDVIAKVRGSELEEDIAASDNLEVTIKFISVVLSLLANAAGINELYATKQPNLVAMLNTYLNTKNSSGLSHHATLIKQLLDAINHSLPKSSSLFEHIKRAQEADKGTPHLQRQVTITDPDGVILKLIAPEIFDLQKRTFLKDYQALPAWAKPEVTAKL